MKGNGKIGSDGPERRSTSSISCAEAINTALMSGLKLCVLAKEKTLKMC